MFLVFNFLRNRQLFSNAATQFYISTSMYGVRGPYFSTSSPTLGIVYLFYYRHSGGYEVHLTEVLVHIPLVANPGFLRIMIP